MMTRRKHLTGTGSVMRPDGLILADVPYEITVHGRRSRPVAALRCSVRLRVQRREALYWFLESGSGLRLTVEDGRGLSFAVDACPDESGWVEVSSARLAHW